MTLVGHGLTGAAIGLVALPRGARRSRALALLGVFAALANVPDFPLPGWGHHRYDVSHSIFVTLGLATVFGLALWRWRGVGLQVGGSRAILWGAAAWSSHLLLDSFYNHNKGVAIFWPLSTARLELGLPWFSTVHAPLWHLDGHSLQVMATELFFFGGLFLVVATARWALGRRSGRGGRRLW